MIKTLFLFLILVNFSTNIFAQLNVVTNQVLSKIRTSVDRTIQIKNPSGSGFVITHIEIDVYLEPEVRTIAVKNAPAGSLSAVLPYNPLTDPLPETGWDCWPSTKSRTVAPDSPVPEKTNSF